MTGRSPDIFPPEPQQGVSKWVVRHPDTSIAVGVRIEAGDPERYVIDRAWESATHTVSVSPDGIVNENASTYSYGIGPHQSALREGLDDIQRFERAYNLGTAVLIGLKNW